MPNEFRGSLYQNNSFIVTELDGLELEKLIICQDPKTKCVIIVFIKVENKEWHQFFLDAGYGFWQNYDGIDPTDQTKCDDEFNYIDKTIEFKASGRTVSKIWCEPDKNNCRILIAFENNYMLIMRTIKPDIFDSDSELIAVSS